MKVQDVKTAIHERLHDHLQRKGFKFRKSDFEFVRKSGEVSHHFIIRVIALTGWFKAESTVSIGCSAVNKLFNEVLHREIPINGNTIAFGVWNEYSGRGSYSIDAFDDIAAAIPKIQADFDEIAVPFFAKMASLEELERYMNRKAENGLYRPRSVDEACLGLIAARLCKNPDFETIFKDYYEFCKRAQGPLAAPVQQMKSFLDTLGNPSPANYQIMVRPKDGNQ